MPVSYIELKCLNCRELIKINGDTVTEAKYRWFLDFLPELKSKKEYIQYVLNLNQCSEVFMIEAILSKLVYRNPIYRDSKGKLKITSAEINKLIKTLMDSSISSISKGKYKKKVKLEKVTFKDLRDLFLYIFNYERTHKMPTLKSLKDKVELSFNALEDTNVNLLRNKIIHKFAYRPNLQEVEELESLINALYYLGPYLEVQSPELQLNQNIFEESCMCC